MSNTSCKKELLHISRDTIKKLTSAIEFMGYTPHIHFELEGTASGKINYDGVHRHLCAHGIVGHFKKEYWKGQWEWCSAFARQHPCKTADDLLWCLRYLPAVLTRYGASAVFLKPVSWSGDSHRMMAGSRTIREGTNRAVHVPNSVHLNISAEYDGGNALLENNLGEVLQRCLIRTSISCSLLFCPEEEAFDRLMLKSKFGLESELSSPNNVSTQSIAFYVQLDKHGQQLGSAYTADIAKSCAVVLSENWQKYSRIEHRLGSASVHYNPHANAIFALGNLLHALLISRGVCREERLDFTTPVPLPSTLKGKKGAAELFILQDWFTHGISRLVDLSGASAHAGDSENSLKMNLCLVKRFILAKYLPSLI